MEPRPGDFIFFLLFPSRDNGRIKRILVQRSAAGREFVPSAHRMCIVRRGTERLVSPITEQSAAVSRVIKTLAWDAERDAADLARNEDRQRIG